MSHFINTHFVIIVLFLASTLNIVKAEELPKGKGQNLVKAMCSGCHGVNRITNSLGYSRENWLSLVDSMIDLSGNEAQQNLLANYLAEHFPPNKDRMPTLVSGEASVSFKEWVVPTRGQRSRDPVEAPNGEIWWVGQWGDIVGKIDPATGEMREYELPRVRPRPKLFQNRKGLRWRLWVLQYLGLCE